MERSGPLPQVSDLTLALAPLNLSTAANNGKWFNMANVDAVNAIAIAAIGTAGDDIALTLEQATDASGTGAKELKLKYVAYKIGATGITAAQDKWVEVATINRDNPASSYTHTDSAENEYIVLAYILQQDLDINNGFKYIRVKVADVGANAQYGLLLYIPGNRAYKGANNFSPLT